MAVVDTWEVQKAVYSALVAANVAGGRVFDRRRDDKDYPNVSIGPATDVNDDTVDGDGLTHVMTLDVWDSPTKDAHNVGFKNVKQVKAEIRAALHQKNLTVTGLASCISYEIGGTDLMDGDSRHSVVRVELHCRV